MRVTMLLADAAQEVNGKLYVLGGGWSVTGPDVPPMALAIKLDVPWSAANQAARVRARAGRHRRPPGRRPGRRRGRAGRGHASRSGRPGGVPAGSDIDFAFAVSVPPFPLAAGRYAWQLLIDGETHVRLAAAVPGRGRPEREARGVPVTLVGDAVAVLDELYDPRWAESWDAVGLVTGDPDQPVRRVLLAVDPVAGRRRRGGRVGRRPARHPPPAAAARRCTAVATTTPKGRAVTALVRAGVALHVAHTNADVADPGVSDALADGARPDRHRGRCAGRQPGGDVTSW